LRFSFKERHRTGELFLLQGAKLLQIVPESWYSIKRVILRSTGLLILTLLIGFSALFLGAGQIYRYQDTLKLPVSEQWLENPEVKKLNAIVVLAGARGRIAEAAQVWVDLKDHYLRSSEGLQQLPVLYISGMGPGASLATLEKLLKPEVFEKIEIERTVIDNLSLNTVENARMLYRTAHELGWDHLLLMTSSYHMRRARFILEHVLGSGIQLEVLSISPETFDPKNWQSSAFGIEVTMQEYLKFIYYRNIL
jgi:uncharacterized SAM-binding protein YcdF (DUF218 family)